MRVIMRANGNRRPVIVGAGLVGSLIGRIAWRGLSREAFPGTSRNLQGSHGGDVKNPSTGGVRGLEGSRVLPRRRL
jgi:hypothetical protein